MLFSEFHNQSQSKHGTPKLKLLYATFVNNMQEKTWKLLVN